MIYNRYNEIPDVHFHESIIADIALAMRPEVYLELGYGSGDTHAKVRPYCGRALAIDVRPASLGIWPDDYFQMTTDEFFANLQDQTKKEFWGKIPIQRFTDPLFQVDLAFIDADHSYEQSLKDFKNLWPYIKTNGIVMFHDSYPHHPFLTQLEWSGTVYKTIKWIKANMYEDCEIVTIPVSPGLTIIRKCSHAEHLYVEVE